ncbi:MAG TPA: sulfite exporter TauE/SafE family protein [Gemmatimonadales bacterium]
MQLYILLQGSPDPSRRSHAPPRLHPRGTDRPLARPPGGGGSILTVPVLVYVLGIAAKPAIAMSLPVVGITSLVGAALHWRLGNVRVRTAVPFGLMAMAGAFAGAKLSVFMSGTSQLALLAVVMLAAAGSMLRGGVRSADATETAPRLTLLVPVALGVGVLTGLVGIGGGFLVVPALVLLAGVPMKQAVGTSLLVIAMNSVSGFAGYLGTVPLDWSLLAGFTTVAVLGALAGSALVAHVPQATLKRAFAVFLLVVGGFVLYQNRTAFGGAEGTSSTSAAPATAAARQTRHTSVTPRSNSGSRRHSDVLPALLRHEARAGELHDRLPADG